MNLNNLTWLQQWYLNECDGDWEHTYGIRIETLDNPGWAVGIELIETLLEQEPFNIIDVERSEDNWIQISIEEGIFKGYGGPCNLDEILGVFRDWATKAGFKEEG